MAYSYTKKKYGMLLIASQSLILQSAMLSSAHKKVKYLKMKLASLFATMTIATLGIMTHIDQVPYVCVARGD